MYGLLPRGTRIKINSGKFAGKTGIVSSHVFQKTEDYPDEAARAVQLELEGDGPWIQVRRWQVDIQQ